MSAFKTLEQSLNTKLAIVVGVREFEHKGEIRKSIKARKSNGKRIYYVTQYANGLFSAAV